MAALVEVKDICKIYNPGENEVRALDHVSVSIQEKGICGDYRSFRLGQIDVDEHARLPRCADQRPYFYMEKMSRMSDDELSDVRNREIGFIFQGFNLIANLTALENVELPLIYRGVGKKNAGSWRKQRLKRSDWDSVCRISHRRCPADSSRGLRLRGAIAQAAAGDPGGRTHR